ncbi:MAG: hypothetical protein LBK95_12620 [Bifidobacteriaceae bacterium]|jgi:hypothetical protein|nr:hypothetical protein [Bifidobacteriaceae bacterium]
MTVTATIRVPEQTRDDLARLAASEGASLSAYLTNLARRERRAAILAAARQEAMDDARDPAASAEYRLWEGTLDDGVE